MLMQFFLQGKKLGIILFLGLFAYMGLSAQQDAMYTQYMFNTLMYNPAYAGTKDALSTAAIYRNQWVDFDGAPKTVSLYAHGPIREKYGLGLDLQHDTWGVHRWTLARGNYSYKFYVSPKAKVSIGINTSLLFQQSNYQDVNTFETNVDPSFAEGRNSKVQPNFGFGIFYYSNMYYLGFSIPNIVNNKLSALSVEARQYRHYYLTGGAVLPLSDLLKLKPSFLLKSVGGNAPLEVDLTLQLYINDVVWTGLAYRTRDSFDFLLGFDLNNSIHIGYAFDLITTEIREHTTWHTHEFMLGYDLNLRNERVISPRYF